MKFQTIAGAGGACIVSESDRADVTATPAVDNAKSFFMKVKVE